MIRFGLAVFFSTTLSVQAQTTTTAPSSDGQELADLKQRVDELERRQGRSDSGVIDLSEREVTPHAVANDSSLLSRAWYENLDVWGFGAVRYLDTGEAGENRHGGFVVPDVSLFLEAHAWERTSLYVDLRLVPFGHDADKVTRTGEVYVHVRDLWKNDAGHAIGLKAGRIYIPFGEEYTWFRAPTNPLISQSAAFPYGFDEGVELYGNWNKFDWIAALTDGANDRSETDGPGKSLALKLSTKPTESTYVGGSFMWNGSHANSAMELSGSHFNPVGTGGVSSAGTSASEKVSSLLYEVDGRFDLAESATLSLSLGHGVVDDDDNTFDRSLTWFAVQPRFTIDEHWFATLRWSEIGTYDSDEGYHADGEVLAAGNDAFGYDTQRLQRLSAGVGWQPNPRTVLKFELGRDRFWVIDGSTIDANADDRTYFGLELAVSF